MFPIPNYQPIPLPIPLWVIEILLIIGFFLHALPMGVMLSGGAISGCLQLLSKNENATRYGKQLAYAIPLFISFAVTQGIVPLLFLQLEYGPLYYTSSIVMAVPWISILVILIGAYCGFYLFKYKSEKLGKLGPVLLLVLAAILTFIGYIFTNNMTLMLTPEKWQHAMQVAPHGFYMNGGDPTVHSRFTFFWLEAFVIGGLTTGCYGLFYQKRDPDYANWLFKLSAKITIPFALLQLLAGYQWLQKIPDAVFLRFLALQHGEPIIIYTGLGLGALVLLLQAINLKKSSPLIFTGALVLGCLAVLDVAVLRHILRVAYTQPFLHPETLPVSIQWDLLIPFLILAVALIIYLIWLIGKTINALANKPVSA